MPGNCRLETLVGVDFPRPRDAIPAPDRFLGFSKSWLGTIANASRTGPLWEDVACLGLAAATSSLI